MAKKMASLTFVFFIDPLNLHMILDNATIYLLAKKVLLFDSQKT